MPKSILITGANSGLGYELTKLYCQKGWFVFPLVRRKSDADSLKSQLPGRVYPIIGSVENENVMEEIASQLTCHVSSLDVLVNNAGLPSRSSNIENTTSDELIELINVHYIGVFHCAKAAFPFLTQADDPLILNISSRKGSFARNVSGEFSGEGYSYRVAKATQNMLTLCMSQDPMLEKIIICAVHPGAFQSKLCRSDTVRSSEEAAFSLADWIENVCSKHHGKFFELGVGEIGW
jgi:NAD(P)-dependent dehydrogenase (short-subunit alcohol dehydrogenase family)